MYFFDPLDFNCDSIPDWIDYATAIRAAKDAYGHCFYEWYTEQLQPFIGTAFGDKLSSLFSDFIKLFNDFGSVSVQMTTALELGTFVPKMYDDYKKAYNNMIGGSDIIVLTLKDGMPSNMLENNVDVDLTTITGTDHKTTKTSGVYMKQMNMGSEFIGRVTNYGRS